MKNEMQVKKHVLDMLDKFLMGNDGGKFKPKMMSVEVVHPVKGKEGLDEVLEQASRDEPAQYGHEGRGMDGSDMEGGDVEDMDLEHVDDDGYECEEKPHMSLKEFLRSRK